MSIIYFFSFVITLILTPFYLKETTIIEKVLFFFARNDAHTIRYWTMAKTPITSFCSVI